MGFKFGLYFFVFILITGFVFSAEDSLIIPKESFENIGKIIGVDLNEEDIIATGVELIKGENVNTLTFLEGGSIKIKDSVFENVEEGSLIRLDSSGNILSASLLASKDTSFNFKDKGIYELSKGNMLRYDEGNIIIEKKEGKETFRFKKEFFDESGEDISKFIDVKVIGDSVDINRVEGGSVINGIFDIKDTIVRGIGEDTLGKITLSNDGRVSEVWTGTDISLKNMNFKISGDNLKMYYDEDFDPLNHKGENYFNFKQGKIFLGGSGYISDLGKENNIFGDMKTTRSIENVGAKERNFIVSLDEGTLEISRDKGVRDDVSFDIKSEGNFKINNGKTIIISERIPEIIDGEMTFSKESYLFVNLNEEKDKLLFSYDINFNNGEYTLKDNVFKNKNGYVRFNANSPEENTIYVLNNVDEDLVNDIKIQVEKETGARPRDYTYLFDEEDKEEILKWFNEAAENANNNKYGVKISTEELWTRYMLEGGGNYEEGYPIYDYDYSGSDSDVMGSHIGLDFIKSNELALEQGGFLENGFLDKFVKEDAPLSENQQSMNTLIFTDTKSSITAFAGELARRKYVFERDFKNAFGESDFNNLDESEKYFWLTYYFNSGEGAGKGELTGTQYTTYNSKGEAVTVQGKGREKVYVPWTGAEPGKIDSGIGLGKSARFNSLLGVSTYNFIKGLKIFSLF